MSIINNNCFVYAYNAISSLFKTQKIQLQQNNDIQRRGFTFSYIAQNFNIYFEPIICSNDVSKHDIKDTISEIRRNYLKDTDGFIHIGLRCTYKQEKHYIAILFSELEILLIDSLNKNEIKSFRNISDLQNFISYPIDTIAIEMIDNKIKIYRYDKG